MTQKLGKFLLDLFTHQLEMKMYHFQTKNYGAHKASDAYLIKFEANLDLIMEVAQGIFGSVKLAKVHLDFSTLSDDSVNKSIDLFVRMIERTRTDYKMYPEITTILEVIMADARQLKYLLTFK